MLRATDAAAHRGIGKPLHIDASGAAPHAPARLKVSPTTGNHNEDKRP
jgi:hypothetical protein